ncbi:MAG TPA: hypothetical protein VH105_13460, partial [Burkholderiales bacterium]|nr:hypothetical protein [Burkholderiales bacterium]
MATSSNKKILLFILGTLALIAIAVVGGGYWWFKYKSADYFKDTQAAYLEARKAGGGMTEQACYNRAAAALKTAEGN